jgi:hypothetical protein
LKYFFQIILLPKLLRITLRRVIRDKLQQVNNPDLVSWRVLIGEFILFCHGFPIKTFANDKLQPPLNGRIAGYFLISVNNNPGYQSLFL